MLIEKFISYKFMDRIRTLRWVVPLVTAMMVIIFEFGPAHWIHSHYGDQSYVIAQILFYGTTGPLMTFLLLNSLGHWLEERETSELQAHVLAHAQEQVKLSKALSDDALQTLFATSTLLTTLRSSSRDLPAETRYALDRMDSALDQVILELRQYLQDHRRLDINRDIPPQS
jgi:hypothetical protein